MKIREIVEAVGYIPKNKKEANDPRYSMAITQDVGPGQDKKETAKLFPMNKDGKPKPLNNKAAKNSNPNTLFNLGLAESVLVKLERDKRNDIYVLHMVDSKDKHRVELRGEKGYETGNYNEHDRLHQVLDGLGKAVDLGALFAGETVSVNPKHPDGEQALNVAKAVMTNEAKGPCPVTGEAVCKCDKVNEKITKRTPMGDVVKDFYASDAPQFKGKSKEKRRQMAIAAKLSKMDENFADGKKKGKSRPGRVKRSGASCKGSVTDLRKRAKKYSGERGKMYQWCLNMKRGRKKK